MIEKVRSTPPQILGGSAWWALILAFFLLLAPGVRAQDPGEDFIEIGFGMMDGAGEIVRSLQEMRNNKAELESRISQARAWYFREYPKGRQFPQAQRSFAEALYEKDMINLSMDVLPGRVGKVGNMVADATGGRVDGGCTIVCREYFNWVEAVQRLAGIVNIGGEEYLNFPALPAALKAAEPEYRLYAKRRYHVELNQHGFVAAQDPMEFLAEAIGPEKNGHRRPGSEIVAELDSAFGHAYILGIVTKLMQGVNLKDGTIHDLAPFHLQRSKMHVVGSHELPVFESLPSGIYSCDCNRPLDVFWASLGNGGDREYSLVQIAGRYPEDSNMRWSWVVRMYDAFVHDLGRAVVDRIAHDLRMAVRTTPLNCLHDPKALGVKSDLPTEAFREMLHAACIAKGFADPANTDQPAREFGCNSSMQFARDPLTVLNDVLGHPRPIKQTKKPTGPIVRFVLPKMVSCQGSRDEAKVWRRLANFSGLLQWHVREHQKNGVELTGGLLVKMVIKSDGSVASAEKLSTTTNSPAFDSDVVNSVRRWRFGAEGNNPDQILTVQWILSESSIQPRP